METPDGDGQLDIVETAEGDSVRLALMGELDPDMGAPAGGSHGR